MIEPIKEDIAQINRNTNTNRASTSLEKAKGHIQEFLECGLSDVDNPSNISTYPNNENFFSHNSLSKALLVEPRGIEPLSESNLEGTSPGAVCYLHSLHAAGTNTLSVSVASWCMVRSKLCARTVSTQITPEPGSWTFRGGWAPN